MDLSFTDAWPQPWRDCMTHYLQQLRDRSGSGETQVIYHNVLSRFFADGRSPDSMSRADVETFLHAPVRIVYHHGEQIAPATRNRWISTLRSFYTFASAYVPAGASRPLYTAANPLQGIRQGKVPIAPTGVFSEDELHAFFAAMQSAIKEDPHDLLALRDLALYSLVFLSARRRGEVIGLRMCDIEQTVFVDESGRQRAGHRYRFFGKGHQNQPDYCEYPPSAYAALQRYLTASGRKLTQESYLFTSVGPKPGKGDSEQPVSGCTVYKHLKHWCERAGLDPKRFKVHGLRHSSAVQRYKASGDVRQVQRALRHANLAMTARYLESMCSDADPGLFGLEAKFLL